MIKDRDDERMAILWQVQDKLHKSLSGVTEGGIKKITVLQAHIPLSYFRPLAFYPFLFCPNTFYERVASQSFLPYAGQDACDAFYAPTEWHEHNCYCSL